MDGHLLFISAGFQKPSYCISWVEYTEIIQLYTKMFVVRVRIFLILIIEYLPMPLIFNIATIHCVDKKSMKERNPQSEYNIIYFFLTA